MRRGPARGIRGTTVWSRRNLGRSRATMLHSIQNLLTLLTAYIALITLVRGRPTSPNWADLQTADGTIDLQRRLSILRTSGAAHEVAKTSCSSSRCSRASARRLVQGQERCCRASEPPRAPPSYVAERRCCVHHAALRRQVDRRKDSRLFRSLSRRFSKNTATAAESP